MQIDLSGRSALVSGSTGGIGFAIARALVAAGTQVVLNGRQQASVDAALARLREGLPDAQLRGVAADVGTAEGCARLARAVRAGRRADGMAAMLRGQQQHPGQSLEQLATQFVVTQRPSSLLRRAASVEEVANLAVYVASPLSSATTGAALRVDGGVVESPF